MKGVRTAGIVMLLALVACKKGSDSASAQGVQGNGTMDVRQEHDAMTFTVGTAFAIPSKWEDGNLYTFWIYNDGVKDPPCTAELFPDDPVGGNNWAVTIEMSPIGDPVRTTDKNKDYRAPMVRTYYVPREGKYKGDVFNGRSPNYTEKKLTIVSFDGETIHAKVEARGDTAHVKGEFKAKVCTPKSE
jgi:hypothetical protein